VFMVLIILAAVVLAAFLLLSTNEGLVRCRDKIGGLLAPSLNPGERRPSSAQT
jgi:hypothetical protein